MSEVDIRQSHSLYFNTLKSIFPCKPRPRYRTKVFFSLVSFGRQFNRRTISRSDQTSINVSRTLSGMCDQLNLPRTVTGKSFSEAHFMLWSFNFFSIHQRSRGIRISRRQTLAYQIYSKKLVSFGTFCF